MRLRTFLFATALSAVAAGLVAVLAAPVHAAPDPAPARTGPPPQVATGVPEDVADWYSTEAWDVLAGQAGTRLDIEADSEADIGLVRPVTTWAPEYVAGEEHDAPVVETEQWLAPVEVDGEGVGVLRAARSEDGDGQEVVRIESLDPVEELAAAVLALPPEAVLVHDEALGAWFTLEAGGVRPLDEAARDSLAGSIPVEAYQPFVVERHTEDGRVAPEAPARRGWVPVAWASGALALLLGWAGLIVWLRREGH